MKCDFSDDKYCNECTFFDPKELMCKMYIHDYEKIHTLKTSYSGYCPLSNSDCRKEKCRIWSNDRNDCYLYLALMNLAN